MRRFESCRGRQQHGNGGGRLRAAGGRRPRSVREQRHNVGAEGVDAVVPKGDPDAGVVERGLARHVRDSSPGLVKHAPPAHLAEHERAQQIGTLGIEVGEVCWLFGIKGGLVSQPQKIAVVSSSIAASI